MSLVDKLDTNLIDGDNNELFNQYRSHLIVAAGVVVLFIILFGYWVIRSHSQETAARLEFALAKTPEERMNVVLKYIGTRQAAPDMLLVADEYFRDGKLEPAEKLYTGFLSTYKGHPLYNGGLLGLAFTQEAKGKNDEAFKLFKDIGAANPPDTYTGLALLEVARVYKTKGELDKAREALGDCMNKCAPGSYLKDLARERLKEITPAAAPKTPVVAPAPTPGSTNAAPLAPSTNAAPAPAATNAAAPAKVPVVPATPPTNASVTPPPAPAATNAAAPTTAVPAGT
ncbi:MAG: tol-pal system YbgF family protein [Candidatus Methylacidiphilales bacterium]|nr:hypothetical protein [Candidatus Methylacidiphilales bacterium]